MTENPLDPQAALLKRLLPIAGNAGIAPGEMAPNAGPAPTLDQPIQAAPPAPALSPLDAIYAKHNVKDGGRGAGFTDRAYWADKPSEYARLEADLSGTGPDQPGPGDTGLALQSGASGGPSPMAGAGILGGPVDDLLSGDPMAKIQAALAQLSGPRSNAQALLQKLAAG